MFLIHEITVVLHDTNTICRQEQCDWFQSDRKCKVALLSLTAANAGFTLTAADTVVFSELFYNPGVGYHSFDSS